MNDKFSMLKTTQWQALNDCEMSYKNFQALLKNEIPSIRISQFASFEECHKLAMAIEKVGFDFYRNVEPPIGRIGITQFEYRNRDKSGYFDMVKKAKITYKKVTSLSFDPLKRLVTILHQNVSSQVQTAYENEAYGNYFAGLIRQINVALLHIDFAQLDAPDWEIGNVTSQLVWNLYVKAPSQGGICKVYNRQWQPEDEKYKIPGSYGYDFSLIANSQVKHNIPLTGDLVIFNSRNFHEVLPGIGERITISSFIGQMPRGDLVFWS
ncbi:2OG-Fe(II)-dependent halogenase WelO5 family protein [Nostoc sp.]|uniref:2OG-Fe(II)-dependent halogenase WelO5 family protein n=1 Tax=Nostoc sp. TaxID=1180 RepID=UPI002FF93817